MIDNDDIDDMPPVRILVAARDVPIPSIHGPVSVFEIAIKDLHSKHGAKANGGVKYGAAKHRREVREGVTVVVGVCYPNNRVTQEKIDAELARRAKQKPPPPTAGFKRISKKFQELVGE